MIRFQSSSISTKLTMALVGALLLVLVTAGVALLLANRLTAERRARQIMEPYAQLVAVGIETAVAFEDPERATEVLATLRANPQIEHAEVLLSGGRVLAKYGSTSSVRSPPPAGIPGVYLTSRTATLVQGLHDNARLVIVMGLEKFNKQTRSLLLVLAAGGFGLMLVAAIALRAILQKTIIRPVATLAASAEQVRTHGDHHQRMPEGGADEVARLGRTFNAMLVAVEKREADLRQITLSQRTILDNVAYGIISANPDGVITSINPAAERLLGYRSDEVIGKETPLVWHDAEEVARRAVTLSAELGKSISPGFEVFSARPKQGLSEEHEWTFIRKNGARVMAALTVTALKDDQGHIDGFVGLTYDLTERKRAEAEIRALNQDLERRVSERTVQLEASNRELEAFCYTVSHDLRAPLRHIDGYVDLLVSRCRDQLDGKGLHYADTIAASARQMGGLIDDLLQFSRTGRAELRQEPADMNRALQEALAIVNASRSPNTIEWEFATLPEVRGDFGLLRQVWINLLENAVKYSRTNESPRILVNFVEDENEFVFSVADNGVGFDMKYAGKLFGVFQRLHSQQDFEGTGIGLATVHRIVTRHGGRVWAEAEVEQGATFWFTLPKLSMDDILTSPPAGVVDDFSDATRRRPDAQTKTDPPC